MERYFTDNTYITPSGLNIHFSSNLSLTRTLHFYWKLLRITLESAKIAKRGGFDDEKWAKQGYKTICAAEKCGAAVHITGLENFRECKEPVIFIGNHMSVFETYALSGIILPDKRPAFVIKQELLDYPFFGVIMKSLRHVPVGRQNPRDDFRAVMENGSSLIAEGFSPIIFPQSTRMNKIIPEKFNSIGVKLAKKTGAPIIPFALKTDFWGTGKFLKDFGAIGKCKNIYFDFAQAIRVKTSGKEEHEKIIAYIENKLTAWNV
jgi:1-acyl-sn-glycerol-3-phosphate acyltransferase